MEVNIARIIQKANLEDQKDHLPDLSTYRFQTEVIIELFPGPALMVGADFSVLHHNVHASGLVEALHHKDPALHSLISRSLNNNSPEAQKMTLHDTKGRRHYYLCALPACEEAVKRPQAVLVTGRETTVEHNLTTALVDSRQMFKDLVSCSSDFSWETDGQGRFKYVSPKGMLGYTAFELNGKKAAELIIDSGGKNPFDTLDVVQDMELWVRRSDGSKACLLVSAVPIIDKDSCWQGARGVCRDVTTIRERDAMLRKARKREHVLNRIVTSIRDLSNPEDMLNTILKASLDAVRATSGGIYELVHTSAPSQDNVAAVHPRLRHDLGKMKETDIQDGIYQMVLELCRHIEQGPGRTAQSISLNGHHILVGVSSHHNRPNGALYLIREKDTPGWNDDDALLFGGILSHLGIALDQLQNQEELVRLSCTDELTGLMNRRAFFNHVEKRLSHLHHNPQDCALLYIDLDNFKTVNDTLGHATGDVILQKLALELRRHAGAGTCVARLGGDEFVLWLEGVSEEEVTEKAQKLRSLRDPLQAITGPLMPALSLSIGICHQPTGHNNSLYGLLEQADAALYHVKKNRKDAVACHVTPETAPDKLTNGKLTNGESDP
tara:strand:- start:25463 stop:27286 length:1824 start_codon:yes stop_codon:yes gene_type:complete